MAWTICFRFWVNLPAFLKSLMSSEVSHVADLLFFYIQAHILFLSETTIAWSILHFCLFFFFSFMRFSTFFYPLTVITFINLRFWHTPFSTVPEILFILISKWLHLQKSFLISCCPISVRYFFLCWLILVFKITVPPPPFCQYHHYSFLQQGSI